MEAQPREIRNYQTADCKEPFDEWLNSLRDIQVRVKIEKRLSRVAEGNLGNYRSGGKKRCRFSSRFIAVWKWCL